MTDNHPAHTFSSIAACSIILAASGCEQEINSTKKPLPAKINWPAVTPTALHARFLHSLGYGGARLDLNSNGSLTFSSGCCMIEHEGSGQFGYDSGVVVGCKPSLPKEYAEYLIEVPFTATVVKQDEYILKLDKGFEDGLIATSIQT